MPFSPDTQAIHSGRGIDPTTGALTAPIHLSTTFERDGDGSYPRGYVYGRSGNPNRDALETALTTLEQGVEAATFASGSAATFSLLQALGPEAHVIAPQSVYFGIQQMLSTIFAPWGLGYTLVDTTDLTAIAQALRSNTRLVLIETPSNPQLAVTDIQAVADLAHQAADGLNEPELLEQRIEGTGYHGPTDHIPVACQVLGGGVNREVGP